MNFLIIDGNSIINRAFYGIKLLTASDGHPTNALYGFMNILLNLSEKVHPDAIAVAFDVHQPTFRHKMYDEYKAGRHPTPPELLQQMEPMKELLRAFGCTVIECPGFEADDILGTLSHCAPEDVHCYISTGDRDSLQLVSDKTSVLLVTTKMGQTVTKEYTPELLREEYGVVPSGMIEIKALQGDNSDNIKGVPGIGEKTAGDLIRRYGSIDYIYEHLDEIEVTAGVRKKLAEGKDSAYFSRTLGTISLEAPIDTDMNTYLSAKRDECGLFSLLASHEMTKLITRLGLKNTSAQASGCKKAVIPALKKKVLRNDFDFIKTVNGGKASVLADFDGNQLVDFSIGSGDTVCVYDAGASLVAVELLRILADENIVKFTNGIKPLYKWALSNGVTVAGKIYDAEIMAYLLDANRSDFSTASLCAVYSVNILCDDENAGELATSCAGLQALCEKLFASIESFNQQDLYFKMEYPLVRVLSKMELRGMAVDRQGIENFSVMLSKKIAETEQRIYDAAGEVFNINSPKQLGVVLFEKMSIPVKKKTKTGYSTNAEVLEELSEDYPVVADILEYRGYAKLKSTYCDGLLKTIGFDGRIRSTLTQTETRTGRLSSIDPNLQNIPVRTEMGREMRKFFIAEKGNVLIDADYSQIELRVLSALAGDKNMLDAFNSGADIHTLTASKVFGVPENEVTSSLRSKAKAVNFGIVYGIGAFSLAKDIKSTRKEAESFINAYLALYSGINGYLEKCIADAKAVGYAITAFGRRRPLPELSASNRMIQSFGERVARNAPIQGTAADIIKIAMIKVEKRLSEEYPDAGLIMQVHDELIIEAPENDAEAVAAILREEMENAVSLGVHMKAGVGIGRNWYEAKD